MSKRYVYLIAGGGRTKIGLAADPEGRLRGLQASSPVELRLLGAVESNQHGERLLHEFHAERRAHGEWFEGEFTDEEVDTALRFIAAHSRVVPEYVGPKSAKLSRDGWSTRRESEAEAERVMAGWSPDEHRYWGSLPHHDRPALEALAGESPYPRVLERALVICRS